MTFTHTASDVSTIPKLWKWPLQLDVFANDILSLQIFKHSKKYIIRMINFKCKAINISFLQVLN